MTLHHMAQRSPDWFQVRLGKLTGSRVSDMLTTIRSGEAAARRDLRLQLVCERLTQQSQESGYVNEAMLRGIELEPQALARYESETRTICHPIGFVSHDELATGCSPDADINHFTGLLEIKCPKSATHVGYLRSQKVPTDYLQQITHALWITGAEWCDFVSYDDRFSDDLSYLCLRVKRSDVDLVAHEKAVRLFLDEVDREVSALQTLKRA